MTAPRRWMVLSVEPAPGVDAHEVTHRLLELGGRAVIEEGSRLVTHLPDPGDPDAVVEALRRTLSRSRMEGPETGPDSDAGEAGDLDIRVDWQEHEEWAEVWKRGLTPRRITPRLVVTPSWLAPREGDGGETGTASVFRPGDLVIVLDPGMAFGTAEHGTTRGCLRLLDGVVSAGDRVLDVGSGSGILSIAAARLGAGEVLAVEGDGWAVEPARENIEANGVADIVQVRAGWVDARELAVMGPRDGVVANIETGILRSLLSGFRDALRPGGWLILSGIPDAEWDAMAKDTEAAGFGLRRVDADGEWRSGLFRRR